MYMTGNVSPTAFSHVQEIKEAGRSRKIYNEGQEDQVEVRKLGERQGKTYGLVLE